MTNTEIIAALRYCGNFEDREGCDANCPYIDDLYCPQRIMLDAAAALEAAEKRIKELESQAAFFDAEKLNYQENIEYRDERIKELEARMPKEGEWMPSMYTYPDGTTEHDKDEWYGELYECSICHYVMIGEENYCPNCGAKMKTVTDCHTFEEGER